MCTIEKIITELKTSNLTVGNKMPKKVIALFEEYYNIDIKFNGFSDTLEYKNYLHALYVSCKKQFDKKIYYEKDLIKMKRHLELAYFEIKQGTSNYISNKGLIISNMNIDKPYKLNTKYKESTIRTIDKFLEIKKQFAKNLLTYFNHRTKHFAKLENINNIKDLSKINDRNHLQLVLFPIGKNSPEIHWNCSAADFMELLYALLNNNAIVRDNGALTRKDATELFQWMFNFEIGDPEGTLKAIKRRKKSSSPFLQRLSKDLDIKLEDQFN